MGADKIDKCASKHMAGGLGSTLSQYGLVLSLPPARCDSIGRNRLSEGWKSGCGAESGWRTWLERRQ